MDQMKIISAQSLSKKMKNLMIFKFNPQSKRNDRGVNLVKTILIMFYVIGFVGTTTLSVFEMKRLSNEKDSEQYLYARKQDFSSKFSMVKFEI